MSLIIKMMISSESVHKESIELVKVVAGPRPDLNQCFVLQYSENGHFGNSARNCSATI